MKTIICLIFSVLMAVTAAGASFKTVIIDAGHGGHDIGGHHGKVYEKWLALDTAFRLDRILRAKGYRTVMTRTSDQFLSLSERTRIANRYSNAIFISIHYNQTWKKDVSGIETFYHTHQGRQLGTAVQSEILKRINSPDRGVKSARFFVLRNSRNPSILVEGGFVSNAHERARMKEAWYREALADGIAQGVINYRRSN